MHLQAGMLAGILHRIALPSPPNTHRLRLYNMPRSMYLFQRVVGSLKHLLPVLLAVTTTTTGCGEQRSDEESLAQPDTTLLESDSQPQPDSFVPSDTMAAAQSTPPHLLDQIWSDATRSGSTRAEVQAALGAPLEIHSATRANPFCGAQDSIFVLHYEDVQFQFIRSGCNEREFMLGVQYMSSNRLPQAIAVGRTTRTDLVRLFGSSEMVMERGDTTAVGYTVHATEHGPGEYVFFYLVADTVRAVEVTFYVD